MTVAPGLDAVPGPRPGGATDPDRCAALDLRGSGRRQRGPDHPHHSWTPLPARPLRRWPGGAGVWVCPVIALDSHEDTVPAGWPQPQWAAGGVGLRPDPNIARIGARDYGLRRGFFRLAGALKALRLPYALAIDVLSAETRPDLVHFGDEQEDFGDAAALCASVDLVVSVDTSVAHLAGALGRTRT
jgi:hypothetical protein